MSFAPMPGDGQARNRAAARGVHRPTHGDAGTERTASDRDGQPYRREPEGAATAVMLAVLVTAELTFVLITLLVGKLDVEQALQAAFGATFIGVVAVHCRAMLLAIGRRIFNAGSGS
jgi:hypothetical protein